MEIGAAVVAIWASTAMSGVPLLLSCLLGWLLLALAVMDARVYRLSDALTLPMLVLGILAAAFMDWHQVPDRAIGAIAGFGVLFLLARAYQAYRGRPGLGLGDAKLFGAGGAWIGWQGLAPSAVVAGTSAIVAVLAARALGRHIDATTKIPFGAFLAIGIWIVWLYAPFGL
jgi:leader peptidase (prepilin peptidase)/N-methyltransferase